METLYKNTVRDLKISGCLPLYSTTAANIYIYQIYVFFQILKSASNSQIYVIFQILKSVSNSQIYGRFSLSQIDV